MTTNKDLASVLSKLYEAGGRRVPSTEIGWTVDMVPAINYALTMQYATWKDIDGSRLYSLTEAGYEAIGVEYRRPLFTDIVKAIFWR